jgi:hypothetical protein
MHTCIFFIVLLYHIIKSKKGRHKYAHAHILAFASNLSVYLSLCYCLVELQGEMGDINMHTFIYSGLTSNLPIFIPNRSLISFNVLSLHRIKAKVGGKPILELHLRLSLGLK